MSALLARLLMALATCWLGEARRDWAAAMRAEYGEAADAGEGLGFAAGCLSSAARAMVAAPEGRFAVATHVLAVGVLVPMAGLLLVSAALGFPYLAFEAVGAGALGSGWPHVAVHAGNRDGVPLLVLLTGTIGAGHVAVAWALLERDWERVARLARFGAAMLATMVAFSAILFLYDPCALPQLGIVGGELALLWLAVRWHDDLSVWSSA
ncbi:MULTISPECIES: hypothetical protein [unclassified Sphingomonas]|uniref:hypothetical protein n=1 Tax=unclassified Sphingomonas TaxID=196159 RepID=UPI0007012CBF|nr:MULTISPECIES: hypothetical protein [unclassified Sphingomonas]KQM27785.1 hypothetical protein ASE58_05400 [Sphingomonas sp. Leaf9]KQM44125.1 hypothetical protein ASE57_05395 [Sphingomonas sp. Leaf11]